jgi:predicted acyltransferase
MQAALNLRCGRPNWQAKAVPHSGAHFSRAFLLYSAPLTVATSHAIATPTRSERLVSLDVFRGLTIALMILVNNNGDWENAYWPLQHSKWNGWTPTDLVFPFFVFIVGVSMVYSISSRLARGDSKGTIMKHVLIRGFILLAIGILIINSFPNRYNFSTMRFEGVLQRIAICYMVAAVFVLWGNTRTVVATIFTCLVGYWLLMRFVPVPGYGTPTHDMPLLDPDRNLAAWLDRKLFMGHLYEGTRDPEGVLSTIPAIAGCLCGVLTGALLRNDSHSLRKKSAWMFVFGVLGLGAGKFFDLWFPINKKLWTSSFVLFTAGFALVVLSLCFWLLDVKKLRGKWTVPVLVFGMNAIAAYIFSEVLAEVFGAIHFHTASLGDTSLGGFLYETIFLRGGASTANTSLAYSISFVFVCWLVMYVLYRKKIFLKI